MRAQITDLNGAGPAAEIELAPGTTYEISIPECGGVPGDEDDNESGDLDIVRTQPLTIFTPAGQAAATIAVDCPLFRSRAIESLGPEALALRNVRITGGRASLNQAGGGVLAVGDLTLDRVTFDDNAAGDGANGTSGTPNGDLGGVGGAAASGGLITVTDSTFTGNGAGDGGNGFDWVTCNGSAGGFGGNGGLGGALISTKGMIIERSTFASNNAGDGGNGGDGACGGAGAPGGAGLSGGPGGAGGAIVCAPCSGSISISASTFSANAAGSAGDGGSGGDGGSAVGERNGGSGGDGAAGGVGGAIAYIGVAGATSPGVAIENSSLDSNAPGGGGPGGGGGTGGVGGSGNGGNGGSGGDGGRGTIYADWGALGTLVDLTHVTLTDFAAAPAGAAAAGGAGTGGGGSGTNGAPGSPGGGGLDSLSDWDATASVIGSSTGQVPACFVAATGSTYSVATDATCGFADSTDLGVQSFASLGLGTLGDNGGPTLTRAPAAASVLIDRVPTAACSVSQDQRQVARPVGTGCDLGAVEFTPQSVELPPVELPAPILPAPPVISNFKASSKKFTFTSTEPGDGVITIERKLKGRKKGKKCVAPKKARKRAKKCTRYKKKGTLKVDVEAGANSVKFSGKLKGKKLPAGSYRATIVASDADGASKPKSDGFKIKKRKRTRR